MHISGSGPKPGSRLAKLAANIPKNVMHIPSTRRYPSKNGLPWGGILGVCILLSISVNIFSLTMNRYQMSLLDQLKLPATLSESVEASSVPSLHESTQRRLASAAVNCSASSSASAHGGHHGPHPHDNMLYLFNALFIGAGVMQLSARFPILQQTIVLFVIGFIASLIMKGFKLTDKIGVWGDSYEMWMDIDPHLLLFTLLPALLAGDAMTIDTSVAKRVGLQCLYLAGPGVLIGGFSTALFLWKVIPWDSAEDKKFLLSLCAGSILCATDPVAVVALLKELGASPMLTVQIQGESLLNDGTAIVLYLISYNMLSGIEYDAVDIVTFLMEKALMAFALGLFIGYFFFGWIRAVSNKLDHSAGMIQITLTLCCAYVSFIFVEGILGLSGVLATVASSLVLAHHMWPYICSVESLQHVWHTLESLGNIIVFFLAGSITGFIVVDIKAVDYAYLILIYFALLFIRSLLYICSRPILKQLHADKLPVSYQDATLMVWGGLRGAVGLALAIQVNNGRAPHVDKKDLLGNGIPQIHKDDAQRLLFYVSGIAFLTTLVNATTAPWVVQQLGITALPAARQTLLKMFHQQLVNWSEDSANPPEVTASLKHMLHEAAEEIDHTQVSATGPSSTRDFGHEEDKKPLKEKNANREEGRFALKENYATNQELIEKLKVLSDQYSKIPKDELNLLGGPLPENLLGQVDDMIELIGQEFVDEGMAKVVNQCFLTLVYNNYWKLIERGSLRPGSPESDVLLTSIRISLSPYRVDLTDFNYVHDKMIGKEEVETDDVVGAEMGALAEDIPEGVAKDGCLPNFVNSTKFNVFIAVSILLNSIIVCVEELARTEENKDHAGWIVADGIFTTIFLVEFLLKFTWLKCKYYKDSWNRFDFFLVLVGILGLVMNLLTQGGGAELAGQTRVMRLARVMRTMRFLRVFRLFNAKLSADKFVSMELAKHMKKITTMKCFIDAQIMAQNDLVKYFGGNGKIDEAEESEIARCVLQSQISTYKALIAASSTQKQISPQILNELNFLYKRKVITEGLSDFVEKAHKDGAISATEAHAILHPLHHQVSACMKSLNERAEGVISTKPESHGHGHGHGHGNLPQKSGSKDNLAANPAASSQAPAAESPPAAPEVPAPETVGAAAQ